ncbi:AAA family ATPase [Patescibacteria group bacterium]|nr:AAA family ATPase [Patescibacteria group bacterium]MBU1721454.1 AAA family ATPase [Patescibacteria group bacterium]MBU1900789.1 AAA family ATPase [Patescibacteria group bacterium]
MIGHKDVYQQFETLRQKEALHHAYCIVGAPHVGKKTLAKTIAATLLDTTKDALSVHPDFYILSQEKNLKTGKTKKNIDVTQIREMRQVIGQYASMKGYKIVIIDGAEKMNIHASNALLKTIEEPTQKTIFFLLTYDDTQLLATIRSRCHTVYLHEVATKEIEDALKKEGYDGLVEEMARFARGCPGQAMRWAKDPDSFDEYKQEVRRFLSLIHAPLYKKIAATDELFGDKSDHILTRESLIRVLDIWLLIIRDMSLIATNNDLEYNIHQFPKSVVLPKKAIIDIAEHIFTTKTLLRQNIHPRLSVEQILLAIP